MGLVKIVTCLLSHVSDLPPGYFTHARFTDACFADACFTDACFTHARFTHGCSTSF